MKTLTVIIALVTVILALPTAEADHNVTDENELKQGHWTEVDEDGNLLEGHYKDDEKHGPWVERWANGLLTKGPYKEGARHGYWVEQWIDGTSWEGRYKAEDISSGGIGIMFGVKHGVWIYRGANGAIIGSVNHGN